MTATREGPPAPRKKTKPEPLHWERQDWDPPDAWLGFVLYRDLLFSRGLGGRTTGAVASELGMPRSIIDRWAAQYHWDARAKAHDEWASHTMAEAAVAELTSQGKKHGRLLSQWAELASNEMRKLLEDSHSSPGKALEPQVLLQVTKTFITLERLIAGEATERTETAPVEDLSKLTAEELEQYRLLAMKAARR